MITLLDRLRQLYALLFTDPDNGDEYAEAIYQLEIEMEKNMEKERKDGTSYR